MIKKFILTIFLFIAISTQPTFSQEIFKITSVNYDTSNSMIFLTSPDNTTESILKSIKLTKMTNPKRAFFDIDSAVLTAPAQNWFFNSGGLKQIKIGQFSTEPNKVRVVLYFNENFDPKNISFLKINNNILIKLKDDRSQNDYFKTTYSEEKPSFDLLEKLSITNQDISKVEIPVNNLKQDDVLGQIQQAFNASTAPASNIKPAAVKKEEVVTKDFHLKSGYFIHSVTARVTGVNISGIGSANVQKPMYLTSPARVVYDIPNSIVSLELRNKEIKINEKESAKLGQFDSNTARVVITTDELEKYLPVFSADGQSILFANPEKTDILSTCSKTTDAVSYYYKELTPQKTEFIIAFNAPIVHGVKKDASKLTVYLYNALRYNDQNFKNAVKNTKLDKIKMELLPKVGLKLIMPLSDSNTTVCELGSDAKSLKITISGLKSEITQKPKKAASVINVKLGGKTKVVIDAGHGGSDYGAIRAGINEKDINLDVAKRVEAILLSKGVSVQLTRKTDETVSLQERTIFCAEQNPNIFVSIHVNSSTGSQASGIETHYFHPQSLELAQIVHNQLSENIKGADRGLFKSKFYVINHTTVPAILVEIGFISNEQERVELVSEERKQQTAKAIANGILLYLSQQSDK